MKSYIDLGLGSSIFMPQKVFAFIFSCNLLLLVLFSPGLVVAQDDLNANNRGSVIKLYPSYLEHIGVKYFNQLENVNLTWDDGSIDTAMGSTMVLKLPSDTTVGQKEEEASESKKLSLAWPHITPADLYPEKYASSENKDKLTTSSLLSSVPSQGQQFTTWQPSSNSIDSYNWGAEAELFLRRPHNIIVGVVVTQDEANYYLNKMWEYLHGTGIITREDLEKKFQGSRFSYIDEVAEAVKILGEAGALNRYNFDKLVICCGQACKVAREIVDFSRYEEMIRQETTEEQKEVEEVQEVTQKGNTEKTTNKEGREELEVIENERAKKRRKIMYSSSTFSKEVGKKDNEDKIRWRDYVCEQQSIIRNQETGLKRDATDTRNDLELKFGKAENEITKWLRKRIESVLDNYLEIEENSILISALQEDSLDEDSLANIVELILEYKEIQVNKVKKIVNKVLGILHDIEIRVRENKEIDKKDFYGSTIGEEAIEEIKEITEIVIGKKYDKLLKECVPIEERGLVGKVQYIIELLEKQKGEVEKEIEDFNNIIIDLIQRKEEVKQLMYKRIKNAREEIVQYITPTLIRREVVEHEKMEWRRGRPHIITPLKLAAEKGKLKIIELLIRDGAEVNKGGDEKSALMYACEKSNSEGHVKVVKRLIEDGADVNAVDCEGKTAIEYARESIGDAITEDKHEKIKVLEEIIKMLE